MSRCETRHSNGEQCALDDGHAGKHRLKTEHRCHARGCLAIVKPELLMCGPHWYRVPVAIRSAVWNAYRPGQCDDKSPSERWHVAADAAIGAVALKTGQSITPNERKALAAFGITAP